MNDEPRSIRPLGLAARAWALARLGRPLFLVGGAVLHAVGAALAWHDGARLDPAALAWGQLTITASQLATHYGNDHFDLEADRRHAHRPRWSGGSGVLPAGEIPPRWALRAALAAGAVAVASATVLATRVRPGRATAALLALAIVMAWTYSCPPGRLHARGLGEVSGTVLLAFVTPLVGYHLQGGGAPLGALAALVPLALLQLAMLVVVSLPDAPSDAAAGKRTLAVRRGVAAAGRLAAAATVAAFAVLPALWAVGVPPLVLAAHAPWLPVALWHARALAGGAGHDPRRWDRAGFWSIGLVVGSASSVALALVLMG